MKQAKGKSLKRCLEEYEKRCPRGIECILIKDMLREADKRHVNGKMRRSSAQTITQNITVSCV